MSETKKINKELLEHVVSLLENNDVVAIPTETVYGLAANIHSPIGIQKIFSLKKRPQDHPLIVHCSTIEMAKEYAIFSDLALELAHTFWPGPLTLILPKTKKTPLKITGGRESVGIRIPNNSWTLDIIKKLRFPIVAPSANLFGKVSPTNAKHVLDDFGEQVFVVDGGNCAIGLESTIIDLFQGPALLRPGKITAEEILVFTKVLINSNTVASGTLKSHYQPNTPVILSKNPKLTLAKLEEQGYKGAILPQISPTEDAKNLYRLLRELDQQNVHYIIAKPTTVDGLGLAINDRLQKAAHKIN